MEYSINELSKLAKISKRTLRYYDEINLLKPKRINSSGYRIYGDYEIDQLQQILFYKEMGFKLDEIREIITSPSFDILNALTNHKKELIEKRNQINLLIENVEKTISYKKGEIYMSNKEKFEGFKKELIDKNEEKYGNEIREKYGNKQVDDANKKMLGLGEEEYKEFEKLSQEIISKLEEAMEEGNPRGQKAQEACELHKKWLGYTWNFYTKEAHMGLGEMYAADERFKKYYDDNKEGMAEFFRDALKIYTR
ncbi:MerR family transcriptional regulator [Terrisporobacter sp.]|uniref:MerR family transcriptional regulator n=1 Tax=Terrisporobacter sp. TaxID=1965305 RepID=UPI002634DB22|nr:MerR family transcriptional regulator [Terrisporobacter sp.]